VELRTERLLLRQWRDDDREPYAALNADPAVMEHFPATLTRAQSDAHIDAMQARLDERGWGLWAVEVPGVAPCIGFIGLSEPWFEAFFTPAVEIGWRLARAQWGNGYAPEGAEAALAHAFDELELDEVVSFTTVANANSRRVMEKIGMTHADGEVFDHPSVADGSPHRRHVLYRLASDDWHRRPRR
jgi:RimJ/RimL family protein N-acetyltransferase